MAKPVIDPSAPRLRVTQVWRDEVMDEKIFLVPQHVTVGSARDTTFVGAAIGLPPDFHLFRHGEQGYVLTLFQGMGGEVSLGGHVYQVAEIVAPGAGESAFQAFPVAAGDWGVLHLDRRGEHVIFFQFVAAEAPLPRPRMLDDELLLPAFIFALALHALFITSNVYFARNPPGQLAFQQTDALAGILVRRPEPPPPPPPKAEAPPQAGVETAEEKAPPASSDGAAGKSGGEGKKPRERDPDPGDTAPVSDVRAKVRQRGLLAHSDKLAAIGGAMPSDRLGNALSRLKGPSNGGSAGNGDGHGTGAGPGTGTGTLTRSNGNGEGGGGTAHADVVTSKIITGGSRAPRGVPGGTGLGEKKVEVAIGQGDGDFDGLTKDQVMKVIMARRTMFQACFEKELQRLPNLAGNVTVAWRIDAGGNVTMSKLKTSSMGNAAVESCLVRRVKDLKFPASADGRDTNVNFPFVFASRR